MKSLTFTALFLLSLSPLMAARPGWSDNYPESLARAKNENKFILVNFTGSDWCPPCQRLEKEYFTNADFKAFAEKNLVLIEVDFPKSTRQSTALQAQNRKLQQMFQIDGYPTNFVLTPAGKPVATFGFPQFPPEQFVAEIQHVMEKHKDKDQ